MEYQHIVVPYDTSQSAQNALRTAFIYAQDCNAQLSVVYVAPTADFAQPAYLMANEITGMAHVTDSQLSEMEKSYKEYQRMRLSAHLEESFGFANGRYELYILDGAPASAITKFSHEQGCDLIVMGSRGLDAVRGALGSVSYAVLRESHCPVLVVK
ncbi:MAG: universal stress protein [Eggerthellaceae bacterium]|nr:universal stress protein [Eggerthellaceae bacterium]